MEEVFKTLEDYPDYAFSNHGRMLNTITGKFLNLINDGFRLSKHYKRQYISLSKLKQHYFSEPIILLSKNEYFEDIPDYPNYKISNRGRVYNRETGTFLTQSLNTHGYYQVGLYKKRKYNPKKIYRLLGEIFIYNDDPINKTQIDHINRIRTDDSLENLRWVSPSENQINSLQIRKYPKNIEKCKRNTNEYWTIKIKNTLCKYYKYFNCNKYTLKQVKEIRNKIYKENNIIALD